MSQAQDYQKLIRLYKQATGETEIDMHKVAAWGVKHLAVKLPKPISAIDLLAKKLSQAAREETRRDPNTNRSYRANHAVVFTKNGVQQSFWIDIDEASRGLMHRSLQTRRKQMLGDAYQLALDRDHWNSIHPDEEPIQISFDFTDDIEERKSFEDDEDNAA